MRRNGSRSAGASSRRITRLPGRVASGGGVSVTAPSWARRGMGRFIGGPAGGRGEGSASSAVLPVGGGDGSAHARVPDCRELRGLTPGRSPERAVGQPAGGGGQCLRKVVAGQRGRAQGRRPDGAAGPGWAATTARRRRASSACGSPPKAGRVAWAPVWRTLTDGSRTVGTPA